MPKLLRDFKIQYESRNFCQMTRPCNKKHKKRTSRIVDLAISADLRVYLKESEKKVSTWTLLGNLKKNCGTWKWRGYQLLPELKKTLGHEGDSDTVVIVVLSRITKRFIKGLEDSKISGQVEVSSVRILRRLLDT